MGDDRIMGYEAPEIHPYIFITNIEAAASTVNTVNIDVHAAIQRINNENHQEGAEEELDRIFSFRF